MDYAVPWRIIFLHAFIFICTWNENCSAFANVRRPLNEAFFRTLETIKPILASMPKNEYYTEDQISNILRKSHKHKEFRGNRKNMKNQRKHRRNKFTESTDRIPELHFSSKHDPSFRSNSNSKGNQRQTWKDGTKDLKLILNLVYDTLPNSSEFFETAAKDEKVSIQVMCIIF